MKYTDIFFDLDDTLWDTIGNSKSSLSEIFTEYGFDQYYQNFEDFYLAYINHNIFLWKEYEKNTITKEILMSDRFYTPFAHIDMINKNKAKEINDNFMHLTANKTKTIDGALSLLTKLQPFYKLHILSNGFEEVQYKKLENSGLRPYFEKIILSDHIGINKPDKAIFNYALIEANTTSQQSIMVGDNWDSDIMGARNSEINQIWFNPNNKNFEKKFEPTYTINKLAQIEDILL